MQTNPESAAVEAVAAIGRLICTQDNRITDQPIFIVQQKRQYITNPDYNEGRQIWVDDEGNEVSRKTRGAECLYVHDVWEFVTACFTEQGCKDYIAKDGHNLREPRIYAAGSFRNDEYRTVRKFLMGMSDPQSALDALRGEVADRDAVIECKNIDIRERDRSLHEWAERARAAERRVAELEAGVSVLAKRWRAEAVKLREQAGRALRRENAGYFPAVPHGELASAANDADSYAAELEALTKESP